MTASPVKQTTDLDVEPLRESASIRLTRREDYPQVPNVSDLVDQVAFVVQTAHHRPATPPLVLVQDAAEAITSADTELSLLRSLGRASPAATA
jgi:hypothetical protein